ncbi:dipeptidase [Microvirga alba]|uniref:Membrane dipeptidase n=1 Tax=Microvirga alba TaxID=2791025 RepID=A0A931FUJ5_9HYPH|nr:membrane dipeptidase [Microvirga alba]MBF9235671.1 membrane dipeptidase [Microvirga alba]
MSSLAKNSPFSDEKVVIDLLGGSLASLGAPAGRPALYAERQHAAGLNVIHVSVGTFATGIEPVLTEIFEYQCLFRDMAERIMAVRTVGDIAEAKRSGRVGVILGCQGLDFIGRNPRLLTIMSHLGLRIASLTYNERNNLGSGCMETEDRGLTLTGRKVVRELRSNRIALDLSHVGYRTSMDAIELYDGPVIFTHSNADTVTPSPRNLKDDQIRAAAQTGGLIGISPYSAFCRKEPHRRPTVDDFMDHIDYIVNLVGINHVAIGTDLFQHTKVQWENSTKRFYPEMVGDAIWETAYCEGFDNVSAFPAIPSVLARRGYDETEISKIMGGNILRALGDAWRS